MISVIGGDENYKNSTEEQTTFLPRWASRKVSSQFGGRFLDGRKGWDTDPRPIHDEVMLHFFYLKKNEKKFVPEPKVEPPVPQVDSQKV